jgi:dCTP deaminase
MGEEQAPDRHSTLSDSAVLYEMKRGNIIIDPFKRENLATSSYDVTLGEWFIRQQTPTGKNAILNVYDETSVRRVWSHPEQAQTLGALLKEKDLMPEDIGENIGIEDRVIFIGPQETILAHTEEYIGGRTDITTMMKARSSLGRNCIEVCKCAGWGDVGYTNRWTLEVTNNSQHYTIPLVVGRRIAQLVFFRVDPIAAKDYTVTGKYQAGANLEELKKQWTPDAMIPKMWKDREVKNK